MVVGQWKCKTPRHSSLQANDKDLEQVFDVARRQVHRDGALCSQNSKCYLLSQVTGANVDITRLGVGQGVLDRDAMRFMIWDSDRESAGHARHSTARMCMPNAALYRSFVVLR
ncbi:hypothetical protein GOP47_0031231 [Adiantum capillus-veneris]|nr:hypothetical protein GOP47_0031231 [Adiantum capillus-veneris]